ncbi:MAG: hypothetical protein GY943_06540 [Chloroflexi bacterium]|nr:hypothetical protein [Chloroflexota bacterium]
MSSIPVGTFRNVVIGLLEETFEHVHGYYLDKQTSLFETLAEITAEQASIPIGGGCATLAAQVKHVAFYIEILEKSIEGIAISAVDWGEIWRTTTAVSNTEWDVIQVELRTNYKRVKSLVNGKEKWESEDEVDGIVSIIVHTAYHLGEIRQALCFLRESSG